MSSLVGEAPIKSDALSEALMSHGIDLNANAAAYPESQWQLSTDEEVRLEAVKARLLTLPLVHNTFRQEEDMRANGILTHAQRPPEYHGTTDVLDQSLGLDEYVFMHWGSVEKSPYGRSHVLIDPNLLFDTKTVVTPNDIGAGCFEMDKTFDELSDRYRAVVESYFSKMVSGKDWFDITARRIMRDVGKSGSPYILREQMALGEVKYHGVLDPTHFTDFLTARDEPDYWKQQIETGFIPGPVSRAYPRVGNDYDTKAEQLGTTLHAGREFWRSVFTEAAE